MKYCTIPSHSPKCRGQYAQWSIPSKYVCFCGRRENPEFDPWLPPHSCGDTCGRPLLPNCGHNCLLLCHPGQSPYRLQAEYVRLMEILGTSLLSFYLSIDILHIPIPHLLLYMPTIKIPHTFCCRLYFTSHIHHVLGTSRALHF